MFSHKYLVTVRLRRKTFKSLAAPTSMPRPS